MVGDRSFKVKNVIDLLNFKKGEDVYANFCMVKYGKVVDQIYYDIPS